MKDTVNFALAEISIWI